MLAADAAQQRLQHGDDADCVFQDLAHYIRGWQVVTGLQDFLTKAALTDEAGSMAVSLRPLGSPLDLAAGGEADADVLYWRRRQWPSQAAAAAYHTAFAAAARGFPGPWPGVGVATDGMLTSRQEVMH